MREEHRNQMGTEAVLTQQPELKGHKVGGYDQCSGHCGGGGAEKLPLPEMLFKVEEEKENDPGF